MKKIIPLIATMLLMTACGNSQTSTSTSQGGSEASQQESSSQQAGPTLSFLQPSEIYVDFNFTTAPEGLSVKIGDTVLTAPGKATMTQGFTYEVKGTFAGKVSIYHAIDAGDGVVSGGKAENKDAGEVATLASNYLGNFANKQYDKRIYFCLTDQVGGWSKTLAGVNDILRGLN